MLKRFVEKMAATGEPWKGQILPRTFELETRPGEIIKVEGEFAELLELWGDPRWSHWSDRSTGQKIDVVVSQMKCGFESLNLPEGTTKSAGNQNIRTALGESVMGLPRVRVNRECTNTVFMFNNYTLPPLSDSTRAKDEACGDPNAVWRYFMLADPQHVEPGNCKVERGGSY